MGGPWVAAAVFCEKVLQEQDGVDTLVRIVDRITMVLQGEVPLPQVQLILLVILKSGFQRGTFELSVEGTAPSGVTMSPAQVPVLLEGEDRGISVKTHLVFQPEEGLYWFDVKVDDVLLTRMPLRVIVQRVRLTGRQPS